MTYTIARYPVHLIDFVSAANGRRVTIRPMLPQDFKCSENSSVRSPWAPVTAAF